MPEVAAGDCGAMHACVVRSTAIILWATHLDAAILALICMKHLLGRYYDACNHRLLGNFGLVKVSGNLYCTQGAQAPFTVY